MKILVINAGSSSMKYQLINMETEQFIAKGICERIGAGGHMVYKTAEGIVLKYEVPFPTHKEAFDEILKLMTTGETKVVEDVSEVSAIGHRIAHGGSKFVKSVLVTDEVLQGIDDISSLAPLHNPPALVAIRAAQEVFGKDIPMVTVFDTSFHQTMEDYAYTYAIPYELTQKHNIRHYGFHGSSHRFVAERMNEILGKENSKIVTCHLGNGSSITAVKDGKSVDTSLGLSTNGGIMMGSRSGDVDMGIPKALMEGEGISYEEAMDILYKKSGIIGVSGVSTDMRDIHEAIAAGNDRARLALKMMCYQIKKTIGQFAAAMGGLDAVVFTGGIGENDWDVRRISCEGLEFLGIKINNEANDQCRVERLISTEDSTTQVWIINTDEEMLIARDTKAIVEAL